MDTATKARREAISRLRDNSNLNPLGGQCEWAYSPSTGAVGMREAELHNRGHYRIINTGYPMYGKAHLVTDWISVGEEKPKRGWHWEERDGMSVPAKDRPRQEYKINEFGSKVVA